MVEDIVVEAAQTVESKRLPRSISASKHTVPNIFNSN